MEEISWLDVLYLMVSLEGQRGFFCGLEALLEGLRIIIFHFFSKKCEFFLSNGIFLFFFLSQKP
jgi:hypothetical protein